MVRYSQTVSWHTRDGFESVSVNDCDTWAEATGRAMALAKECGWTPPRWWQFWRWGDYDYSELEEAFHRLNK